jgi:hypothetical protein
MLLAHEIYGEDRFFESAKRGGDFLILAQMPAPQPAWAQQYNFAMQPVWARVFEPPSVSGGESQAVMFILIDLARVTGDTRYLDPIPRAIEYLRSSILPNGNLARFYELRTNKPLFINLDYRVTYRSDSVITHYGLFSRPQLDAIARSYEEAKRELTTTAGPRPTWNHRAMDRRERRGSAPVSPRSIIAALDARGAWVEPGTIRIGPKERAPQPVIESRTFIANLLALSSHAGAAK